MSDAAYPDGDLDEQEAPKPAEPPACVKGESEEAEATSELKLLPFYSAHEDNPFFAPPRDAPFRVSQEDRAAPAPRAPFEWRRFGAAASLAAVIAIVGAAAAAHVHGLRVARAEAEATQALAHRLDAMSARLESLETHRMRDEIAGLRKVLTEIKSSAASTRDVGGAVTQLASRVDRLEKEQPARLDKLGDRMDRDAAQRLADVSARLEKLEAKIAAPAPVAAAAPPKTAAKSAFVKTEPGVSYDPTGSILAKPRPRLRGFWLSDIQNGYAMIGSPAGEFVVGPGDMLPGGGRVLRIERHGRDWAVITTQGQIVAANY